MDYQLDRECINLLVGKQQSDLLGKQQSDLLGKQQSDLKNRPLVKLRYGMALYLDSHVLFSPTI